LTNISKPPTRVSPDIIRMYYYSFFDQNVSQNSGIVIDDACYELLFVKENNVAINTGDKQSFILPHFYTFNNLKGPFKYEFSDTFTGVGIKLQPWMNASFVPMEEPQVVDLNTLYSDFSDKLHETLFKASSTEEMFSLAERFMLSIQIEPTSKTEFAKKVCEYVYEKSGIVSVAEISDHFNIYRQKLNQSFKEAVKYTLKNFIDCVRIRACVKQKIENPEIPLTEIGYNFGYYDQAHFIRAFRNASGVSPTDYLKTPGYSARSWNS